MYLRAHRTRGGVTVKGFSAGKSDRLLMIYSQLVSGAVLTKRELAQRFQVTEKSIQRDIEALRCFFAEQTLSQDVVYDPKAKGYRLIDTMPQKLSNSEILAVCKILLESRSMRKDEMLPILDKLIACCVPEQNKAAVNQLIANEKFHYIAPHHGKPILDRLWDIGQAIQNHQVMEIQYERIKFKYTGPSIEAVLDRLPTAKIVKKADDGYIMEAEVFGKGIEMWMRSQGEYITYEKGE